MDDRLTDPGRDWPAPAKINLFLHVVGRRADGYHLLQTGFQFLDLCDTLDFRVRDDGRIRRTAGLDGVPEDEDLVVRAARRLQADTGTPLGADIHVTKRIPAGGGLGGGSSDAATTLLALDRLWNLRRSVDHLAALGLALGADVPVFVRGQAAWGEGVGEILTPFDPPQGWVLVLRPDCHVPTATVFKDPELTRNSPPITMRDFLEGRARNDCEPIVRQRFPAVAEALDWLARHGRPHLTGTGACVYATFASRAQAEAVAGELPPGWQGFVARTLNASPLRARLAGNPNAPERQQP